jgi:hypothetical protein
LPKLKTTLLLLILVITAFFVHGYHPYAEDAEIYLPGAEKILHPELFPVGAEFFQSHANATLFPNLIAESVRVTHLPLDYALFFWQILSVFLFLLACYELSGISFEGTIARWGSVLLVVSLLTMPVAGTSLYIIDPYLNPRNLAAFASIFAVSATLTQRYLRAVVWLVFAVAVHPLMALFPFCFCVLLVFFEKVEPAPQPALALALLPFGNLFVRPTPAYREAMRYHSLHLITNWQWYELLGAVAPVLIFVWFARVAGRRKLSRLRRLCQAAVWFNVVFFVAALIISIPTQFEALTRLQPLRSLHLLYILMLLAMGGLAAEYILKKIAWRWAALFLPIAIGMFLAQRSLFPANQVIEWPWSRPTSEWQQAFLWIRQNTPTDAVFAINPFYLGIPGEGYTGFRALAERSRLVDAYKDSGAVSMFPPLAQTWWQEFQAEKDWNKFDLADFARLAKLYGVNWVVLEKVPPSGFDCPFRNSAVSVCRFADGPGDSHSRSHWLDHKMRDLH